MTLSHIDYMGLINKAMLSVVRKALEIVVCNGMPDVNQFLIEFITDHPGVVISNHLSLKYPDRMTIVLQYEFEDLIVTDCSFSVSISINNKLEKMTIPFAAITAFQDPDSELFLDFIPEETEGHDDQKTLESKDNVI